MRLLCVVPARCKSQRIPHKNLSVIRGRSLIHRALDAFVEAPLVQEHVVVRRAIVSTDCVGVALTAIARAIIWERRCGADGPMAEVLAEVLNLSGHAVDAVVCLQPTSPFRTGSDIDACIWLMMNTGPASSIVSVNADTGRRNGAVYVTRSEMLRDGLVYDEHSLQYPMPAERSLDINLPTDLLTAHELAAENTW